MKVSNSKSRTGFLEVFDTVLEKCDKVPADKMPASQKIGLLKKVANADEQLLQTWIAVETIISYGSVSDTATMYEKCWNTCFHILRNSKKAVLIIQAG